MEGSEAQQIPQEVREAADRLGIPVEDLLKYTTGQASTEGQIATEVHVAPAETREQQLERELAETQQEVQQVRKMAQTAEEGRVIGSGGGGVPANMAVNLPNLGMIEPGIRWEYLNGRINEQELADKIGPLLTALLVKHQGGAI